MTSAELGHVADLISELDVHTLEARGEFKTKFEDFEADLKASTALDMEDLFGALEMMVFAPSKAMGLVQGAKLGYSVWKELDQVETDSGRKIDKKLIVTQIKDVTSDFSRLGEGFRALKSGQPISQDDQGAARLLVTQSQFEDFFKQFLSRHPARAAKEALNEYVDSIQKRNQQIDVYNLLVMRYLGDKNEIKSLRAQQNLLAAEADQNVPRQKAKDYLISAYNSLRDRCVRLLYMTGRAYYYFSLQPLDTLGDQLKLGQPDEINLRSIIMAKSRIIDAEAREIEDRVTPITPAPPSPPTEEGSHGATIAYVRNKEDNERYDLVLEKPELLDLLSEVLSASVPLRWTELERHDGYNPFSGKANVRLRLVRCWIYGLQTENNRHRIRLMHGGDEDIIDSDGNPIEFEHTPLQIPFEYDASDPEKVGEYAAIKAVGGSEMALFPEKGSFTGQGYDLWEPNHYAPVGPFTEWKIMIRHDLNVLCQPIHIDKLVLEFFYVYDLDHQ